MDAQRAAAGHRRRRYTSGSASDITALIAALGGNAEMAAVYDTRYGVTSAAGAVSAWADARGAGFAPSMVQATPGSQPAWDGALLTITSDGIAKYLASPLSPLFDISGDVTLVYVGAVVSGSGVCGLRDGISVPLMKIISGISATVFGGAGGDLGSTVASSATRRVVIARKQAAANTNTVQIANVARQGPGTGSVCAAGNRQCIVGASGVGGEFGVGVWRAILVIRHATTPAEDLAIRDWAIANHAAVAA